MGSLNDQLVKHIDEAIAMEENVKRMLDGMIQTSDDPGVIDLLEHACRGAGRRHQRKGSARVVDHSGLRRSTNQCAAPPPERSVP